MIGLVALAALLVLCLGYLGSPLWIWTLLAFTLLAWINIPILAMVFFLIAAAIFNIPALRREAVTVWIFGLVKRLHLFPKLSATEREALLAGDSWIERDLFSGRPDLNRLMALPYPELSGRERNFVEGPIDRVCASMTDWEAWQRQDLPPETWAMLKTEGVFGMIIPTKYGGLDLTPYGHSEVIQRLASRSAALAITAMVPNSLGPAKLLLSYGTREQKEYYLPRLARGIEIPCFALTEPEAGSDAAGIQSEGVLFRGTDAKLYLRLDWEKRYTTLAPAATLLGLAFRLRDPERLLGGRVDVGITCALIPTHLAGVEIKRRHDPMGVPFLNAPNKGHGVVVPADAIIGGLEYAGRGWTMVMQALADGRGISLPAEATGGAKLVARVATAYAAIRTQFGLAIGRFEGVAERLARIGVAVYTMDATRTFLCGALGEGLRPPVATAIAKVELSELGRKAVTDAMDVLGGAGLSRGPRNLIANSYIGAPIGITVEGANIMTRALIIFGQGVIRCHPFAFQEIEAFESNDQAAFDLAFWGHVGHLIRCAFRAVILALFRGWPAELGRAHPLARYRRRLSWASASFAFWSELSMLSLGGSLKRREKLTGRLADALSWMLLATSVLRRFEAEGRRKDDLAFARGSLDLAFREIAGALDGVRANLKIPAMTWAVRGIATWIARFAPLGARSPFSRLSEDAIDLEIARRMQAPGSQRERIFGGVYLPSRPQEPLAELEQALRLTTEAEPAWQKIRRAVARGQLHRAASESVAASEAYEAHVISEFELESIRDARKMRETVVKVDDFSHEEFRRMAA